MIVTRGKQNMQFGQVQEFSINLETDIRSNFKEHKILFNNSNSVLQGALLLSDQGIMVQQSNGSGGLGAPFLLGPNTFNPDDYYLKTTPLNNITLANGSLSLNSQKITNLSNPTTNQDAATKYYVDQNIGISQSNADNRYYLNTTPLNNITLANGSLSLNSQKITNLADATTSTDGLNRQTGDNRYYLNTTPLNSITLASSNLNMNNNRINNVVDPVLNQDAATKHYVDSVVPSSALSVLKVLMINTQTTNISLGDHIKFETIEWSRGSNITLNTSTYPSLGRFTLLAGNYVLQTDCSIHTVNANTDLTFQIWNVTDNVALTQGLNHKIPISSTEKISSMSPLQGVFTLTTTKVIEVRIVQTNNNIQLICGTAENQPAWCFIQQI